MISDPNDFFTDGCGRCARGGTDDCNARRWGAGLAELRRICLDMGLEETAKWGHPCYMAAGRNIAILGAFRGDFDLGFMNASLLKDPEGLLQIRGAPTRTPSEMRFTDAAQVLAIEPQIRAYLAEAIGYAKAGIRPERKVTDYPMPEELVDALDADADLAEAWEALTPGRQRGYCFHIGQAKQSATRAARIEKYRDRIFAGKGYNEYLK
jgi:uncharacterized protein YdeI (YjbR/CyaY-like superfamily)